MTMAACRRKAVWTELAGDSPPPPQAARRVSIAAAPVIRVNIGMRMTQGNLADGNAAHPRRIAPFWENFCQLAAAY
jgi:hypothetical protein